MADADEIARLCYRRFAELPRRGKPEPGREWTLMAAVVQLTRGQDSGRVEKEVVSLGTGTKCIGRSAMSPTGDVLNDSHAEVMARRGCVRYLIQELHRVVSGSTSSVFDQMDENGRWRLKPGVSFVFFTSHTPCGDASIIPMMEIQTQPCPPVPNLKRRVQEPDRGPNTKRPHLEVQDPHLEDGGASVDPPHSEDPSQNPPLKPELEPGVDIHRTGAKCVPGGPADPLHPGSGYHSTGVLRVKPGRGEPTMSLSCSDKLARWGVLGFQGALLAHYLQGALYFSTVVVGKCPYSPEVMHRALVQRCSHVSGLPVGFSVSPPVLVQSSLEFPFNQAQTELQHQAGQGRISPCGAAISWCNVTEQPLDVTANGYKHGVTKKVLGTAKARSVLCKLELFHSFLSLVSATTSSALPSSLRRPGLSTYWDYKQASQSYQQAWNQLQHQAFPLWPRSDRNLLQFR
ncbi:LOW QUALITY PROTEIN: tRNA-specific adenosine deaminase 1-like [Sphaeramia orbicularis]|uniref:LOW QUALITY PROTEIN: tRNA-specific adenosine deaminase 1-like n=1 Tax=Sphaeramia orbicularis TaxID=375764 RepID=UPI001180BF44|nr:LOW QUALITY PROTEIN: tRNA-specific adenosine deaminase 1-like [Sphaeramia orbicularis]